MMKQTGKTIVANASNPKRVSAGLLAAGIAAGGFWYIEQRFGMTVPAEVAGAVGAGLAQLVSLLIPDHIEA